MAQAIFLLAAKEAGWTFRVIKSISLQRLSLIWLKKCFFCGSKNVVRNGLRGRTQRYKCNDCGRRFDGGIRRDKTQVITDYVEGKQTLAQLAVKYGVNEKTIRRDLEGMRHVHKIAKHKDVTVQMDTTYWGRNFGLMVIRDALRGRSNGFRIYGAVIDGMKGLPQALKPVPVQMCQFHQMLIVRRYLTQDPEIEASRNLLELVNGMTATDKESFIGAFNEWYDKYRDVVNERVHDGRIKRRTPPYMRPRLRSAYLSVKRNMPLLWTFYDHPETGLPNTNNALEGLFSDLKTKVRVHSGISREHREKLLDEYIRRHY